MSPHVIERLDDSSGPRFRLVGPGVTSKWYTGKDQLERLEDLRDLMNYAAQMDREARAAVSNLASA
jgi:hypothetical protein